MSQSSKAAQSQKVNPHNLDAEGSLLGAIIQRSDRLIDIADNIQVADFFDKRHQKIYQAILNLSDNNKQIDILTVSDQLKKKSELKIVGGRPYLAQLIEVLPTVTHHKEYAAIVRADSRRRGLIRNGRQISELGYDTDKEIGEIIEIAEKKLFDISQQQVRQSVIPLSELLEQKYEKLEKLQESKDQLRGVSTGFVDLDNLTAGFHKSDLIILAARPAMGKTSFALNLALSVVKRGHQALFFSLEMGNEQLVDRLLSISSGIDAWRIRSGKLKDRDYGKINQAMGQLDKYDLLIDDSVGLNISQLRTKARRANYHKNLDLIIIDYLQLMSGMRQSYNEFNRVHEITEISRALKMLARELDLPIVVLSQLNRQVELREDHRPNLADLRDSGAIEQDADLVMFLYRDDYYNPETKRQKIVDVLIKKHRNGPVGQVELYFDTEKQRYRQLEKQEKQQLDESNQEQFD